MQQQEMPDSNRHILSELHVYGEAPFGVKSPQMSAMRVSQQTILATPQIFGVPDVFKTLQMLPGVQPGDDGSAEIYVRGGTYDQNLVTIGGTNIYNSEHMAGYVCAINPFMLRDVRLYKGAFPAHLGSRVSAYVSNDLKDGSLSKYRGTASVGMLSSALQFEGPIFRDRTSFSIGARASYYDLFVKPIYKQIIDWDKSGLTGMTGGALLTGYRMDYYDLTARVMHKISDSQRLSATFYYSGDVYDSKADDKEVTPDLYGKLSRDDNDDNDEDNAETGPPILVDHWINNGTKNHWHNILGSLRWEGRLAASTDAFVDASISHMDETYDSYFEEYYRQYIPHYALKTDQDPEISLRYTSESNYTRSRVTDCSLSVGVAHVTADKRHSIAVGADLRLQRLKPSINASLEQIDGAEGKLDHFAHDSLASFSHRLSSADLYAEDDCHIGHALRLNYGLRLSLMSTDSKNYLNLQPRLSMGVLMPGDLLALKASYARTVQGVFRLTSSNIAMPINFWTAITDMVKPMVSDQAAVGLEYEPSPAYWFSAEAYYKNTNNMLEYREGMTYMGIDMDWQRMVAQGRSYGYGLELMARKRTGRMTWTASYTWQKTFNKFDREGNVINGGRKYYAPTDRRNSLSATLDYRASDRVTLSAKWTYMTGRRGTLRNVTILSAIPSLQPPHWANPSDVNLWLTNEMMVSTQRNGFVLPSVHHLDLSVDYVLSRGTVDQTLNLSIYNVYNRKNVSRVYYASEGLGRTLKGICNFPFMPSVTYIITF